MKSKLAERFPADEGEYSELQVLHSPAGYYIGTIFRHKEGWSEPGSRDSHYFEKKADAEAYLARLQAGEDLPTREHP